jgi:hypothetical protein
MITNPLSSEQSACSLALLPTSLNKLQLIKARQLQVFGIEDLFL